jgi:hypothetical protein
MTSNVRILRRRFLAVLAVLAVVDVAAVVVLVSPVGAANPARQAEFEGVRRLVQLKMHSVIPPDKVQHRRVLPPAAASARLRNQHRTGQSSDRQWSAPQPGAL